jgi:hypothetical protein
MWGTRGSFWGDEKKPKGLKPEVLSIVYGSIKVLA